MNEPSVVQPGAVQQLALQSGATEQVPNTFPSLFWGYVVIWGLLVLYIAWLGRRLSAVERARGTH